MKMNFEPDMKGIRILLMWIAVVKFKVTEII